MIESLIFAGIAVAIGGYLIFKHPSWIGVGLFIALLLSVPGMVLSALGQPKPAWAGCALSKESTVVGFSLDEGRAIYLWLQTSGAPLSCQLPWNEQQAAQISDADAAAKAQGVPLKIKAHGKPGQTGTRDDEKLMAYPAPQPPLPLKQGD